MHSFFHEAVSEREIQKIIDGHRSSSGEHTWTAINSWSDDNVSHVMSVERATKLLDYLLFT